MREREEPADWEEFYGEDPDRKMDQAERAYEEYVMGEEDDEWER